MKKQKNAQTCKKNWIYLIKSIIFVAKIVTVLYKIMPKRWISILSVAFAAVMLVMMHSLPHHHHGDAICFTAVSCESGHHDTDAGEYPYHHHADGTEHYDTCVIENSYLFSFGQNDTKCKVASCHQDHSPYAHLFPVSGLAAIMLLYEAPHTEKPSEYGECHICFYQSVSTNRDNGLRAPPRLTA